MADTTEKPPGRQFSIFTLMKWTALIALLVMAFSGGGSNASSVFRFTTMPADDQALQQWYAEEIPRSKVDVSRKENQLRVDVHYRFSMQFLSPPMPPWETLGYSQPQTVSMSFNSHLFRLPTHLVLIGIVVFIGAWLLDRRKQALAKH